MRMSNAKRNLAALGRHLVTILVLGALLGGAAWLAYQGFAEVLEAWTYRDEPQYLARRAYDPLIRGTELADAYACGSPARVEPTPGVPNPHCFAIIGEHELREWGLDPETMTPYDP